MNTRQTGCKSLLKKLKQNAYFKPVLNIVVSHYWLKSDIENILLSASHYPQVEIHTGFKFLLLKLFSLFA